MFVMPVLVRYCTVGVIQRLNPLMKALPLGQSVTGIIHELGGQMMPCGRCFYDGNPAIAGPVNVVSHILNLKLIGCVNGEEQLAAHHCTVRENNNG